MASFKKVQEIEEIIDDEEFVLPFTKHNRPSNLPFPLFLTRRMKCFPSRIKTQPNIKPISEWKRGIFLSFLTH